MNGIAFKVTYNDGGAGGGLFGFDGVCSNRNMLVNVRDRKMTNCSRDDGPCRAFVDKNFLGKRPSTGNCYESHIFQRKRLEFGCGFYHRGPNDGRPIPVNGVEPGHIAFLTTLLPERQQHERIVFACFRVARKPQFRENWGYMVESDGTMDVRFPAEVAAQMNFWRYFQNADGSKLWGTGLFRHINADGTTALLNDALGLLGDDPQRDVLLRALGQSFKRRPVRRLPVVGGAAFGDGGFAGGESEEHRKLKEFVASNPIKVGLPKASTPTIEFPYQSGDQVDVKFDLPNGTFAVVEVETIDGWTGAHQCVKYRALLEAHEGLPLGSGKVKAILVAHAFDRETREFAKKYAIETYELKV